MIYSFIAQRCPLEDVVTRSRSGHQNYRDAGSAELGAHELLGACFAKHQT